MDESPLTREASAERPRRSNGQLFLLGVLSPGLGFDAIGRGKQGWGVFFAFYLFFLLAPFTPLSLLALPLWWLFAVLAPLRLSSWSHPRVWPTFLLRLVLAVAMSLGLRAGYGEAYKIPAGSMLPALEVGDHIYASKLELWSRGPERGELVIFVYPVRPEQDFIKRVVGLPGDTIAVVNDELVVNGSAVRSDGDRWDCPYWDRDELGDDAWSEEKAECRRETLGGHTYTIMVDTLSPAGDFPREGDASPYVVPPGHYFVLGDNRSHSSDSRFWGPVPAKNLKAIARYIWYSKGPSGIRWSRLGQWLR